MIINALTFFVKQIEYKCFCVENIFEIGGWNIKVDSGDHCK